MLAGISKPLIFVVVLFLGIALICSSFTPFIVLAVPPASGWGSSKDCVLNKTSGEVRCCWRERVPGQILGVEYCQTCERTAKGWECDSKEKQAVTPPTTGENIVPGDTGVLEQPPTPPSFDPTAPLQGGVLEQQQPQTPPTPPLSPDMPTLETVPPNRTLPGGDIPTLEAVPPETGTMEQRAPGTSPPPQSAACYPNCPPPPPPPPPPNHVVQQTPPSGPAAPLQGGEVLDQPPTDQGAIPTQPLTKEPEAAIPTQPAEPTDEVAEKKVCEYGTSATGACYPPPKCPAGTVLAPGTGGDCRPPPVPPAAREVAPEVPPEVIEQAPEETPAEEQPSEDSNSEDNGNN